MSMYVCDANRAGYDDESPAWFCRPLANDTVPRHPDGCVNRGLYGQDWVVLEAASPEAAYAEWERMSETQRWATVEQELFEAAYLAGSMSLPEIDECWTPES